jgi:hypothetical protein
MHITSIYNKDIVLQYVEMISAKNWHSDINQNNFSADASETSYVKRHG